MEAVYCRKSNLIATISPPHHLPPIAPIAGVTTSVTDYPSRSKGKKLKILKLSLSVLGGILVLGLTSTLIIILYRRKKKKIHLNLKWEEDQTLFEVLTITRATNNFSLENKIGEGGYGPVYKPMWHVGSVEAAEACSGVDGGVYRSGAEEVEIPVVMTNGGGISRQ
nr:G-type lectin S-receptor-like serine/threonine-protein kinase At4g27290 [Ipomoea batatas]GME20752.1 G-type lectin S-receptor-like serine/threonine-protein kinase At4g27290 [Ipomoea batatas]